MIVPASQSSPPAPAATMPLAQRIALDHDRARLANPLGHQVHVALAMLYLALLPVGTAAMEVAFGILVFWTVVRLPVTWRCYLTAWRVPINWAIFAWVSWEALSLIWSIDRRQGFDELGACRVLILPVLLWPVLDRLPWLIAATLAGVLVQNGAQLLQALEWLNVRPQEGEGRFGGLVHPIHTGAWCLAAMCWNLSAILHARTNRIRILHWLLLLCAAAGLLATESRGPWLAAAICIPLLLALAAIRRPAVRRQSVILLVIGLVACLAAWPLLHERVAGRISEGVAEARSARDEGVYWSSVGLRVGMTRWAWRMFAEHPLIGLGAGSYKKAQSANADFKAALARAPNEKKREYMSKSHPHSLYLYTLACTGIIGASTLVVFIGFLLRRAWVDPPNHVFADGTFCVLLGWIIGTQSDTYHLNGQMLGLLAFIVAITMNYRPRPLSTEPRST